MKVNTSLRVDETRDRCSNAAMPRPLALDIINAPMGADQRRLDQ